ncbi:hypothetical protein JOF53_004948 [Crossiella equi]|uniref:Uncharacterized protein n=1 Tax=Crossiella equi TaxID=130796 RepID=A0ABS5AI89_9PSEU|nr:hypothetical protein [Crossiella equi]
MAECSFPAQAHLDQLALAVLGGVLLVHEGQQHRAERGGDEQRRGELEGEEVVDEQLLADARDVARGLVDRLQADGRHVREGPAERGDQQRGEADTGEGGGQALTAQHLDHRVRAVPADQHQHEQEQHHDRAGVDDDLHHAEERRLLHQVQHAEAEHGEHQPQRGVHRVAGEEHAQATGQRERAEHPEHDLLAQVHDVARFLGLCQDGDGRAQRTASSEEAGFSPRASWGPFT